MSSSEHLCRACGQPGLTQVLDLGHLPLANALLAEGDLDRPEPRFPLAMVLCPHCQLAQITETLPPSVLFSQYVYFSSWSQTMLDHAQALARRMVHALDLGAESLVLEVGSNDGYLLQFYQEMGIPVLGVDPAANVAQVAHRERGVPTLCEFFGLECAQRLSERGQRADLVHAHNVLAHVADLNGFVEGLYTVLKPRGRLVVEVPYLRDLVDGNEFDTIYHEHLCYFSLSSLVNLLGRHGLVVTEVERLSIHGGSLRGTAARDGQMGPGVESLLVEEDRAGLGRIEDYMSFQDRVVSLRRKLVALLGGLKGQGRSLAAYGAAAKGTVLLNYCGLDGNYLDYVVDRNPAKQGLYLPGVRLPIDPPEMLCRRRPDFVLLLAWNIAREVMAQQTEYRRAGGGFIIPIPEPRLV
jgi:SAM-dependent methyltransferase